MHMRLGQTAETRQSAFRYLSGTHPLPGDFDQPPMQALDRHRYYFHEK
jgi:hypothetical protein